MFPVPHHGNHIQSTDLIKAITQASSYICEVERDANSVKFLESVDGVKTVKLRCVLIFGCSNNWSVKKIEAFRLNDRLSSKLFCCVSD